MHIENSDLSSTDLMHSVCSVAGSLICWTPQLWAHEPQRPTAPSPVRRPALPQVREHCLSHLVSLVVGSGFSDLLCPRDALIQTYQDIKSPRCPGLLSNLHRLGPFSSQVSDPLVSPISGPISDSCSSIWLPSLLCYLPASPCWYFLAVSHKSVYLVSGLSVCWHIRYLSPVTSVVQLQLSPGRILRNVIYYEDGTWSGTKMQCIAEEAYWPSSV